ncbi:MAG: zinc ribbon domain-containing protein [Planctomycetes bacterium]|nr:zinc ribbon domain-containing protein [Planctomycetota bacterium]
MRSTRLSAVLLLLTLCAASAVAKPCPECSVELAEEARFCTSCGHAFLSMKSCPGCQARVFGDARFCSGCGHKFPYTLEDEERFAADVVRARNAYLQQLRQIEQFYTDLELSDRATSARSEREACQRAVTVAPPAPEAPHGSGPDASRSGPHPRLIPEADALLEEAETFRRRMNPLKRHENLTAALERYQQLLLRHPESDKADDAAHWIGYIYESQYHTNYEKAIEYYRKCVAWNPVTSTDAWYRIAYILDYNLRDRAAALDAYRAVLEHSSSQTERESAERRIASISRRLDTPEEPPAPPERE